jgi:hypothetical protein
MLWYLSVTREENLGSSCAHRLATQLTALLDAPPPPPLRMHLTLCKKCEKTLGFAFNMSTMKEKSRSGVSTRRTFMPLTSSNRPVSSYASQKTPRVLHNTPTKSVLTLHSSPALRDMLPQWGVDRVGLPLAEGSRALRHGTRSVPSHNSNLCITQGPLV